mgnify:CR=1 FL=1
MLKPPRDIRGFTLIEVMIVVVIVSILLMVALPGYQHQLRKTRRNIAKGKLVEAAALQEQFFVNNKTYAFRLSYLGYTDADNDNDFMVDSDAKVVADGSRSRIYLIRLQSSDQDEFLLHAVPQLSQAKDAQCPGLSLNQAGQKGVAGSFDTEACW